jgi:hypothetical protein
MKNHLVPLQARPFGLRLLSNAREIMLFNLQKHSPLSTLSPHAFPPGVGQTESNHGHPKQVSQPAIEHANERETGTMQTGVKVKTKRYTNTRDEAKGPEVVVHTEAKQLQQDVLLAYMRLSNDLDLFWNPR